MHYPPKIKKTDHLSLVKRHMQDIFTLGDFIA